jgi:crossover junction endodeoxyribonuclease RuvC
MGNGEFRKARDNAAKAPEAETQPPLHLEHSAVPIPHSPFAIPHSPPRILGIDPGLNITGYAVLEAGSGAPKVIEAGVVRGKTKDSLVARLAEIHDGVADVIATLGPAAMALEQLYSHYDHPRTSILMGHARGVICLAAAKAGIEVTSYSATQIKKVLTGNGRAPKSQMQAAIQRELRLAKLPEPADVADALAIALCHYYLGGKRQEIASRSEKFKEKGMTGR